MSYGEFPDSSAPNSLKLTHLGKDIWLNPGNEGPSSICLGGKSYQRFLDRLYVPMPTHKLTQAQIFLINGFRKREFARDPQFRYNEKIKSIFREIAGNIEGPKLEVGPYVAPILGASDDGAVLCDIDEEANEFNRGQGFHAVAPSQLTALKSNNFSLIMACFAFHFPVPKNQASEISRIIMDDGLMIFNVIGKSAATRTNAVNLFSKFGLRFSVIHFEPIFGKEDALFIGSKDFGSGRLEWMIQHVRNSLGID